MAEKNDFDDFFSQKMSKKADKLRKVPPSKVLKKRPFDFDLVLEDKITKKDNDVRTARNSFMENYESNKDKKMKIKLFIKCPGCFFDKSDAAVAKYWFHKSCGTAVYIEETGYLSCEKETCKKFFIRRAKFYCNRDHGVEYTQYNSLSDMMMAITHGLDSLKNGLKDQSKVNQFAALFAVNVYDNWEKENA